MNIIYCLELSDFYEEKDTLMKGSCLLAKLCLCQREGSYLIKIKPLPNKNSNTFTKWVCKPAHTLLSCTNASKELHTLTPQLLAELQALFYQNILIKILQKMANPLTF